MQFASGACEMMHLQMLDVFLDRRGRRQHHRHPDQSAQRSGHTVAEFQSGQRHCAQAARHKVIDHRHRGVDGRHQPQNSKQTEPHWAQTLSAQQEQGYGEEGGGHNGPRANVALDAKSPAQASGPRTYRRPKADGRLECAATTREQVVARIPSAIRFKAY